MGTQAPEETTATVDETARKYQDEEGAAEEGAQEQETGQGGMPEETFEQRKPGWPEESTESSEAEEAEEA